MIAWFLIAIATIAAFGYIAVNGIQTTSTTMDATARTETVRRLNQVANGLLARAAPAEGNGVVYLPAGQPNPAGKGYGLPADLRLQGQTPFSQPFVYCPFGATGGTGTALAITSADTSSYTVATKTLNGKDYVVGGRPPYPQLANDPNIIGWVIAPRSKLSAQPSCDQVIYNGTTGKFEAPDAVVRAISRDAGADEVRAAAARKVVYYVSPSGGGNGASRDTPTTFTEAFQFFASQKPASMTIMMAPGYYPVAHDLMKLEDQTATSALTLKPTNGIANQVTIDPQSGASLEDVKIQGPLYIEGINFDSLTRIWVWAEREAVLKDMSVGSILNYGSTRFFGTVTLTNSLDGWWSIYGQANSTFRSQYATLNIAAPGREGIALIGSSWFDLAESQLNFSAGPAAYDVLVHVDPGARFTSNSSTITTNIAFGSGFNNYGAIDFNYVTINHNAGSNSAGNWFGMGGGSTLRFYNSKIQGATRANSNFVDWGSAARFTSYGSQVKAGANGSRPCWDGPIFAWAQSYSAGGRSTVENPEPLPALTTADAAETAAYTNASDRNARRALMRTVNASDVLCV